MEQQAKTQRSLLTVLFLGVLIGALDIAIVGPALPAIQSTFGVSTRILSWIFSIYILFNLISTPLMAKLSDRYGRRLIYTIDMILFAIGSLLMALSPLFLSISPIANFPFNSAFIGVLVARSIQGFGAGGIFPVASAVIGDTFPPEKRGAALGLIGAVFGMAFLIGPIIGGVFLLFGWPWLFIINIPFVILLLMFGTKYLPTAQKEIQKKFDFRGLILTFMTFGFLAFGINQIDETSPIASLSSWLVWPFIISGIILFPILILFEGKTESPIINFKRFNNHALILVNLLTIGAGFAEGTLIFLPSITVIAFGVSESVASFLFIPLVIAMAAGSPIVGRILDKHGPRNVIILGTFILIFGFIVIGTLAHIFAFYMIGTILIGIGLASLLGAPLRYIVLNETPANERASFQGVLAIFTSLGELISGAFIGGIAASIGGVPGFESAYLVASIVAIILFLGSIGIKKYPRANSTPIKTSEG